MKSQEGATLGMTASDSTQESGKEVSEAELVPKETRKAKKIRASLDRACGIFRSEWSRAKSKSEGDMIQELERSLEGKLQTQIRNKSVLQIWMNMKLVDPVQKEEFWSISAKDLGVRKWSCPEIQLFYDHLRKYREKK